MARRILLIVAALASAMTARATAKHADLGACGCGHSKAAHQHYRRGTECAHCAVDTCRRYRPQWLGSRA